MNTTLGCRPDLALLIKAFISLEGMGRNLDPNFHMATEALPAARQVVRARQPGALAGRAWSTLRQTRARWSSCRTTSDGAAQRATWHLQVGIELAHLSAWATRSTAQPTGWPWRW